MTNSILYKENKHLNKSLTMFDRFKNRLLKQFQTKKLIGDILINDSEYELLIDYFKVKSNYLLKSSSSIINDPLYAVALVFIGIKYYDGNFWGHVARILDIERLNPLHQGRIGDSFTHTLMLHNKLLLSRSERVNNILMHGFVSDNYANEMFDFLFKYYNIDLERDLERNNAEMMNSLIEVAKRNDNTGRTYLLVKQTADALRVNTRGGKIRLRRILRLIDQRFWEQILPGNPVSRLSVLFNSWQETSSDFQIQYNKYHGNILERKGKKSYSAPYINCDFLKTQFKLVLPTQLIKFGAVENVKWQIISSGVSVAIPAKLYPAVTGYKTETEEIYIDSENIFNEFVIELTSNSGRIRFFKIHSDNIRFFDADGCYVNSVTNLPKGEMYSFTKANEMPLSNALIENERIGNLVRSYFELEYGDVIRLPDGKPISIGKRLEEGLLHRSVLVDASALYNEADIPIYCAPPSILIKIANNTAKGTLIDINGNRYRLFDSNTTVVELGDRSGETGYIINLHDLGCVADGIYRVFIDVPNDRTNRLWHFALVNQIEFEFEDAPYIFKSKGTIRFNEGLELQTLDKTVMKNSDDNSFNFLIDHLSENIRFTYVVCRQIVCRRGARISSLPMAVLLYIFNRQ